MIKNRTEAGIRLAKKLEKYKGTNAIVLALPRGGVVLGYEIAHALNLPLDIVVTRKITNPLLPEYAIGAVDNHGTTIFNTKETALVNKEWLRKEIDIQKKEAKRRVDLYRKEKKDPNLFKKIVIIVDDGIATGFTMRLAVKIVKNQQPKKIIVAVPISPLDSIQELKKEGVSEVCILDQPEKFSGAVGAYYQSFEQVEDDEVIRLLHALT